MVLVLIPTAPRSGCITVAILTVIQFLFLIYAITSYDDFKDTPFIVMVVVFSILCIIASICLLIGAIRLNRKLIVPYILAMSLFVCSYTIVFIVMIARGEHRQKDWIHFTIIAGNVCFLIAAGALYRMILKAEQGDEIQVTIATTGPPPTYSY